MRMNVAQRQPKVFTHEGGPAVANISAEAQLRRTVMSCLLWESEFYESGKTIADRIVETAQNVKPEIVAAIAIEAREVFNLRHVPLLLLEVLTRTGKGNSIVAQTIGRVIQRADELGEFVAVYTHGGDRRKAKAGHGRKFSAQVLKGLRKAFAKFDEYALAKYDRDGAVKLRDVIRFIRPTPANPGQAALWKRALDRTLATPDTWEVALSGGADKKETFERLLRDGKLGYLALLRNLRNMVQAGVDEDLVRAAILARKGGAHRVFPFRYVAAARVVPQFERYLDQALVASIEDMPKPKGKTLVLVDVSGSMDEKMSGKSDMMRIDAAAALASIMPGDVRVFTFSNQIVEVPPRRGMAGVDAITKSQSHSGTYLGQAVAQMNLIAANNGMGGYDRLIVVTDEQSADRVPDPVMKYAYMINVASNKNGLGYGKWTHIDGFSEGIFRYIAEVEREKPRDNGPVFDPTEV